jgi:hypothetical protein
MQFATHADSQVHHWIRVIEFSMLQSGVSPQCRACPLVTAPFERPPFNDVDVNETGMGGRGGRIHTCTRVRARAHARFDTPRHIKAGRYSASGYAGTWNVGGGGAG